MLSARLGVVNEPGIKTEKHVALLFANRTLPKQMLPSYFLNDAPTDPKSQVRSLGLFRGKERFEDTTSVLRIDT